MNTNRDGERIMEIVDRADEFLRTIKKMDDAERYHEFVTRYAKGLVKEFSDSALYDIDLYCSEEELCAGSGGRNSTQIGTHLPMGGTVMVFWAASAFAAAVAENGSDAAAQAHIDNTACGLGWDYLRESGMASESVARDGLASVARVKNAVHYLRSSLQYLMPTAKLVEYVDAIVVAIGRLVEHAHGDDAEAAIDEALYAETNDGMRRISAAFFCDMFIMLAFLRNIQMVLVDSFEFTTLAELRKQHARHAARHSKAQRVTARRYRGERAHQPCPLMAEAAHYASIKDSPVPSMAKVLAWAKQYTRDVDISTFMRRVLAYTEEMHVFPGDAHLFGSYDPSSTAEPRSLVMVRSGLEYYNALVESLDRRPHVILEEEDVDTSPMAVTVLMTAIMNMYMVVTKSNEDLTKMALVMMHNLHDWRDTIASAKVPLLVQYLGGWSVAFDGMALDPDSFETMFPVWLAALCVQEQRKDGGRVAVYASKMLEKMRMAEIERSSTLTRKNAWVSDAVRSHHAAT